MTPSAPARVPAAGRLPLDRVLDPLRALGMRLLHAAADAADPSPSRSAAVRSPLAMPGPGLPRHVAEVRARFDALEAPVLRQRHRPQPGRTRMRGGAGRIAGAS